MMLVPISMVGHMQVVLRERLVRLPVALLKVRHLSCFVLMVPELLSMERLVTYPRSSLTPILLLPMTLVP